MPCCSINLWIVVFLDAPFALQVIALEATSRFGRNLHVLAQTCACNLLPLRIMFATFAATCLSFSASQSASFLKGFATVDSSYAKVRLAATVITYLLAGSSNRIMITATGHQDLHRPPQATTPGFTVSPGLCEAPLQHHECSKLVGRYGCAKEGVCTTAGLSVLLYSALLTSPLSDHSVRWLIFCCGCSCASCAWRSKQAKLCSSL